MGIMSAFYEDISKLAKSGFDDKYISISTGLELEEIKPVINYFRKNEYKAPLEETSKKKSKNNGMS